MEGLSDQLQTAAGIKGIDGYLAAFPNALRGLEGRRLRNVVEAVHSGVLEGWRPTEENVAAIAQSRERGPMTPERAQAICDRVRARRNDQKRNRDKTPTA
ncbi:hypothetical protein [Corynebacterium auriscanis]|uniref:hypothetical protein n=1 Tax=Corynebacterium auriscanis TaxID=99807 RepID=UPI0024AE7B17|nr:hypothetical protein [Corynebacterium auriscanis]